MNIIHMYHLGGWNETFEWREWVYLCACMHEGNTQGNGHTRCLHIHVIHAIHSYICKPASVHSCIDAKAVDTPLVHIICSYLTIVRQFGSSGSGRTYFQIRQEVLRSKWCLKALLGIATLCAHLGAQIFWEQWVMGQERLPSVRDENRCVCVCVCPFYLEVFLMKMLK